MWELAARCRASLPSLAEEQVLPTHRALAERTAVAVAWATCPRRDLRSPRGVRAAAKSAEQTVEACPDDDSVAEAFCYGFRAGWAQRGQRPEPNAL